MTTILKRLPSPAMLVACLSLIVALGGVSYAAGVLPKNSVGAAQLKKKAVTAAKIKNNSVSGAKVKDRTLTAADFGTGQLPAGPKGDPGPQGDPGQPGPKGEPGRSALSSLQPGETVRGVITIDDHATAAGQDFGDSVTLPIPATTPLSDSTVDIDGVEEVDNRCTGAKDEPTAPPGVLCIYAAKANTASTFAGSAIAGAGRLGFRVVITAGGAGNIYLSGSWAYTEPN